MRRRGRLRQGWGGRDGRGACRGERACFNNPGPIARGACVGPPDPITGMGVCEVPVPDEEGVLAFGRLF